MSSLHVHYEYEDGSANTIRPTSVTYPDGRVLTYNYGTSGGMNDRLSRVESLGFDGTGNLVQPAYLGLGTQVKTTYNEPQVRWDLATGTSPNPYSGLDRFGRVIDNKWTNYSSSTTLDQIKYTYDRASNRTSRENVVAKAQTTPKYFDELYSYDGSNRLTEMQRGQLSGSPPSGVTNKQFAQDWGLDPTGNWKVFKEDTNGNGTWDLDQTRTSKPVNEITAINETAGPSWITPGYDSAGNMTTIPRPAEPTGDFTGIYDAWNRLVELRGLDDTVVGRYEYDGLTRRVVKHTFPGWEELEAADWDAMTQEDWNGLQLTQAHRRDYYYNTSWQILEERVENDTVFDRQYVWGLRYIDGLVFRDRQLASSVQRNYVLQDANWNVTALTDDNGAVVERYSYAAYGVPTFLNLDFTPKTNTEDYDWDVLYAGYKWDSESALYQVRFRFLQPAVGGWISRDPIGYQGNSLNLYSVLSGNPLIATDSLGLLGQVVKVTHADAIGFDVGVLLSASPWFFPFIGFSIGAGIQLVCNCDTDEFSWFVYLQGGLSAGAPWNAGLVVSGSIVNIWGLSAAAGGNGAYTGVSFNLGLGIAFLNAQFFSNSNMDIINFFTNAPFTGTVLGYELGVSFGGTGALIQGTLLIQHFWNPITVVKKPNHPLIAALCTPCPAAGPNFPPLNRAGLLNNAANLTNQAFQAVLKIAFPLAVQATKDVEKELTRKIESVGTNQFSKIINAQSFTSATILNSFWNNNVWRSHVDWATLGNDGKPSVTLTG